MIDINWSYDREIENTYIITLQGNKVSETMSKRCQDSCTSVGQKFTVYPAFDGTSGEIKTPNQCIDKIYMKWFKQLDHELSITEVACALSHISLWCHCIDIDKPIVILEHDVIMTNKIEVHPYYNSIIYLGNVEQALKNWPILNTPTHASNGHNYHFICRAHAYAIDPQVAKNLVAHVLKMGICESLDMMIRADIFSIVQMGVFAYDLSDIENTTIVGRKKTINGTER